MFFQSGQRLLGKGLEIRVLATLGLTLEQRDRLVMIANLIVEICAIERRAVELVEFSQRRLHGWFGGLTRQRDVLSPAIDFRHACNGSHTTHQTVIGIYVSRLVPCMGHAPPFKSNLRANFNDPATDDADKECEELRAHTTPRIYRRFSLLNAVKGLNRMPFGWRPHGYDAN
jgi:hypothetical protein